MAGYRPRHKPKIAYELLNLKAKFSPSRATRRRDCRAKESSDLAIKAEGASSSWAKMDQDLISSLQTNHNTNSPKVGETA